MSHDISDLEPEAHDLCVALVERAAALGHPLVIVQTYRSALEQAALYAKGRTRPGEPCHHWWPPFVRAVGTCRTHPFGAVVTNAPPGSSWHEARRAFDVAFGVAATITWSGPWEQIGQLGESLGLSWGGRWRSPDRPHFEHRGGISLAAAIAEARARDRLPVPPAA